MSAGADLEFAVKATVQEINAAAISRSTRALNIMRNTILTVLSKEGSGRVYKRGAKGFQVASAPGETPAPDSGSLRKDWHGTKNILSNGGGVRIILRQRSDHFYQTFLEHGTRKMAPRPHVDKIQNQAKPKIAALFASI